MVIDHQAHWHPPEYLDSLVGRRGFPRAERRDGGYVLETAEGESWLMTPRHIDLEVHLADMDANGVDAMVSSPSLIGELMGMRGSEVHEAADRLNELTARAQREHPERFIGLAVLPMHEPDIALRVLDRAVPELGLRGVCIHSNVAGESIARDELLAIYRRVEELGVPIFLHPTSRSAMYDDRRSLIVERGLNWMCDSSIAAMSLVYSGTLDACPALTVVHPHLGGVLPYVAGRLDAGASMLKLQTRPIDHYLRHRFYTDTASDTLGAFGLAARTYGEDRILFATDYPWKPREGMWKLLRGQDGASLEAAALANRLPGWP